MAETLLERREVLYCSKCGMPPEYCEYGPDFESHCIPWLQKHHPALYAELFNDRKSKDDEGRAERPSEPWTVEQRLTAFYEEYVPEKIDSVPALLEKYEGKEDKLFVALVKKYGPEPEDPYYAGSSDDDDDSVGVSDLAISSGDKKKRRGVGAKKTAKVDTRVIIQKISRNKRKAVTIVVGMDTVPDVKLKDVSKAFSKRFAGSSSVKDGAKGKEIIIQGDHMDDVALMIIDKFKVPSDSVYLDMDGEFVPFG
jgi:density-regulated protein DRP1|mmetsp:Transcript_14324/g.22362  ORF Transcript_14324/g.22362 Transcript_14324/m.22362 type:complete len:253 (-) Transcript_14324:119-877(-)